MASGQEVAPVFGSSNPNVGSGRDNDRVARDRAKESVGSIVRSWVLIAVAILIILASIWLLR